MSYAVVSYDAEDGNVTSVSFHSGSKDAQAKHGLLAEKGVLSIIVEHDNPMSLMLHEKRYDASIKVFVERKASIDDLRSRAIFFIREHVTKLTAEDMEIDSGTVQAHSGAAQSIHDFAMQIRAGVASPHGGVWRMKDNSMVDMSDEELVALDGEIQARNQAIRVRSWELIDKVSRETQYDALEGFDIEQEWIR